MTRARPRWVVAGAGWLLSAVLLLAPGSEGTSLPDWLHPWVAGGVDKVVHGVLFIALGALTVRAAGPRRRWAVLAACLAWGLLTEWAQSGIPERSPEGLDVLANGLGSVAGVLLTDRGRSGRG